MSNGIVYERATWAPRIGVLVSGSLLAFLNGRLVPTPITGDATAGRKPGSQHHDGTSLSDWVRLVPTPTSSDGTGGMCPKDKVPSSRMGGQPLKEVYQLLGTPTATDSNSGPNPPEDDKSRLKAQVRGPLNPSLHLWLIGWPEGFSDYAPVEREWFLSWQRSHGIDSPEES